MSGRRRLQAQRGADRMEVTPGIFKRIKRMSAAEMVAADELASRKRAVIAEVQALAVQLAGISAGDPPAWCSDATRRAMSPTGLGDETSIVEYEQWRDDLARWHAEASRH